MSKTYEEKLAKAKEELGKKWRLHPEHAPKEMEQVFKYPGAWHLRQIRATAILMGRI